MKSEPVEAEQGWDRIKLWLACVWPIAFCIYFYSFTLPNNPSWNRAAFWIELPAQLSISQLFEARWGNLVQRMDLIVNSTVILVGCWAIGGICLRLLRTSFDPRSLEFCLFASGLGLSAFSLITLGCGLLGWLSRPLFLAILALPVLVEVGLRVRARKNASEDRAARDSWPTAVWVGLAVVFPFLVVTWLGSMSPSTDFDMRAYHLLGPKEWYEAGRIRFLEHNVYTSFPFLTEMIALAGMVLGEDWYWGAVAGKCALFAFMPLTGLALFIAGRRWFSPAVGAIAAVIHLTTPWICRISIIGYAEGGLTFYLFAALLAAMFVVEQLKEGKPADRLAMLAGLLAGSAMACKYTGLVQVVAPLGLAVVAAPIFIFRKSGFRTAVRIGVAFGLGTAIAVGPWLLKNLVETGNPVYPLAYSLFGGRDLNPELVAKWQRVHSPPVHDARGFLAWARDVIADSDWLSALLYAFAPLALLWKSRRKTAAAIWLYVIYLFLAWWGLTHRLDRFWVPMIPAVALLAGIGAGWLIVVDRLSRTIVWILIALSVWFNLGILAGRDTNYLCGYNAFLIDRDQARAIAENRALAPLQALGHDAKVLCVGDGDLFEARVPIVYNTVFDQSIFQQWLAGDAPQGTGEADLPMRSAVEIREKLKAEGITHIYVNWSWIRTYRQPGNYGYTAFVTPARFAALVQAGVLKLAASYGAMSIEGMGNDEARRVSESLPLHSRAEAPRVVTSLTEKISDDDRRSLASWAPELIQQYQGHPLLITSQVYEVAK